MKKSRAPRGPSRYPTFSAKELATEQWRAVPESPLWVSTLGRVKSFAVPGREWLLNPMPNGNGYLQVNWRWQGARRSALVSRLVLTAFVGPCPEGQEARHVRDPNPYNNRLVNLAWGTRRENIEDMRRHGNGCWKLLDSEVLEIAARLRAGEPHRKLAKQFKVSQVAIHFINAGKTYAHLTGGPINPRTTRVRRPGEAKALVQDAVMRWPVGEPFGAKALGPRLGWLDQAYFGKVLKKLVSAGLLATELRKDGSRVYWRVAESVSALSPYADTFCQVGDTDCQLV